MYSKAISKRNWSLFVSTVVLVMSLVLPVAAEQPVQVKAVVKPLLDVDGYLFKDLNANGVLDPYEDWRLSAEDRADDLLQQMTLTEKIAQMQHPTFVLRPDGQHRPSWKSGPLSSM